MENLADLLVELGCKVGSLSFSYLGLPLGAPFKSTAAWDGVKERFRKRLSTWKRIYFQRRENNFIRSILSSLPNYFISLLCMSRAVRLRL